MLLSLTAFGQPELVHATETQGESYIIGMDQTMAPFTFLDDDGKPSGLELEIFEAIAADQEIDFTYQNMSFSAALQLINQTN